MLDKLSKGHTQDKKNALVKLNDVKKQLEDRQKELGSAEELKKQLSKLKDVDNGAASQLAEAMADGDFEKAKNIVKELAEKLKNGKLSDVDQQKLANDLDALAKELHKMVQKHEQAKKDLEQKIQQAQQDGDLEQAAKLQEQLEKIQDQEKQLQKLQELATKLGQCAECMKQGNNQGKQGQKNPQQSAQQGSNQAAQAKMADAGESLEDLIEQMEQMEQEMQELEALEDMAAEIGNCKNGINDCQKMGDKVVQGDWAQGAGKGFGKRDKKENETGSYQSRVKGKLQQGETVVTGHADGDNLSGKSVTEARELVKNSMSKKSDPLENQKLPRAQREHVKQYFENLRKGD
jgi:hypothetical protein